MQTNRLMTSLNCIIPPTPPTHPPPPHNLTPAMNAMNFKFGNSLYAKWRHRLRPFDKTLGHVT